MGKFTPTVAVLLSTYNGQQYLQEQLTSIMEQQNVDVTLYVRDDGSQDDTLRILSEYKGKIKLFREDNIGVGNSFMQVLYRAGLNSDYYAFCDQDDIWLLNKLEQAILKIADCQQPVLYCSNQTLTDGQGHIIKNRHQNIVDTSYMQILCDNKISGCTMVWNRALQGILYQVGRRPSDSLLVKRIHDVWVAMVASVAGRIIYDPASFILYRQHGNNVVGVKENSFFQEWFKKIRNPALRNGRSELAGEIVEKYRDLITDNELLARLKHYANYRHNWADARTVWKDAAVICQYSKEIPWHLKLKILFKVF